MNDEDIRELFRKFTGDETFRKFAYRINRDLQENHALRHWQERDWAAFLESHPDAPTDHNQIRRAFSWCYIHQNMIVSLDVATWAPQQTHDDFHSTCEKSFPFCYGNHVCMDCVEARGRWLASHPFIPMLKVQVDWTALESALFDLAMADIAAFADKHANEMFYGFAFDCNADYGQAMLCLNTPEFHQAAIAGTHIAPEIQAGYIKMREDLGLPTADTLATERAKQLKWRLGDWKYQDFSSAAFNAAWKPFEDQLCDAAFQNDDGARETHRRFLMSVCRVAIRLEKLDAFTRLKRTDDFCTYVADHDETEEDSWERLNAVRTEA